MKPVVLGLAGLCVVALSACTGHISEPAGKPLGSGIAGETESDHQVTTREVGGTGGATATGPSRPRAAGGAGGRAGRTSEVAGRGGTAAGTLAGAGSHADAGSAGQDAPPERPMRLYGVTVDALDPLSDIEDALKRLAKRPYARVVFDPQLSPQHYAQGVRRIHAVSGVMGELVDSIGVAAMSTDDYAARTSAYLDALENDVDIWEIGNEINGEWLGDAASVRTKILTSYQLVHARGKATALTLFYNEHCFAQAENEMFRWAKANVPDEMRDGLDYVLISYYEDNCKQPAPDWNGVFTRLAQLFPHSKVGFGECGTTVEANKAAYVERYYQLDITEPAYVGGYFWWYFRQDMLPYTSPLWTVLNQSILASP